MKRFKRIKYKSSGKKKIIFSNLKNLMQRQNLNIKLELNQFQFKTRRGSLCLICRGSRLLCGKARCPALLNLYTFMRLKEKIHSESFSGSSPPGVFVGRFGYPYVYAGPLVPPYLGDTTLFDSPELWLNKSMEEIIDFRVNLIRSKFRINVKKPYKNNKFFEKTLELALSKNSVDMEVSFKKKPSGKFLLDETVQPMGPSALLKNMRVDASKTDFRIEKAYSDGDLKAREAILNLYSEGVSFSKIQRAFSIGAFGLKKNRKVVPTRWSITAVDSTLSKLLIDREIKKNKLINEYEVYEFNYLGNLFIILLTPSKWEYEWMEAWYPGTTWNLGSPDIAIGGDWEGYKGRNTYASIGGCYYAVRLAVSEFLKKRKRQAGIIAMREIYPSYTTPLGVWINREGVREALRKKCEKYDNLNEAVKHVDSRFNIKIDDWINNSKILKESMIQRKINSYF